MEDEVITTVQAALEANDFIVTMVDNGVVLLMPGAIHAELTSILFWGVYFCR
ncbi:MAG TPA: hypothetical protein VJ836_06470 [Candidatus Saccharimonadales bacterium]|nr:hypothetical protein [Candidatus Saccharimonadales bacterium]